MSKAKKIKKTLPVAAGIDELKSAEKQFATAKTSLAKQCEKTLKLANKDLASLKSTYDKLNKKKQTLKKQKAAAADKIKAKGAKATKAMLAKLETAKKAYDEVNAELTQVKSSLNDTKMVAQEAKTQAKKFSALDKLIIKFEKDWDKKLAAQLKKAAKKSKKPRAKAKAAPKAAETSTNLPA